MASQPTVGSGGPFRRGPAGRPELVSRLRDRLSRHGAPRTQLLLILLVAGSAAFVLSAVGLAAGFSSMTLRYPLAALFGYLTFLGLIRLWIGWQRGRWSPGDLDLSPGVDGLDISLPARSGAGAPDATSFFRGGRSGGAGASESWSSGAAAPPHRGPSLEPARGVRGGRFSIDVDPDALWFVVLAVLCALAGLLVLLYLVYVAPVLLAEVALDGAVVTGLYRRLRREDASHWAATTLRRTWVPAALLVVFCLIGGFALGRIAPEAQSIGGVIRALVTEP
jgi:hypothetical protein